MSKATPSRPGSQEAAALRRQALGDFLRSARARISPQSVGLPMGVRRRTPGLRREEVAQLCDISTTWYTWIEQGRDIVVSPAVCVRLADTLRLDRAERHYLFELAEVADPDQHGLTHQLPAGLNTCVDQIQSPAYILDRTWNVLARNAAMVQLFNGWPDRDSQPNLLRYIFLDAEARHLVVDWEQRATRVVSEFRGDVGAHVDEPELNALLQTLRESSAVFAQWWGKQTVVEREGGLRSFNHPQDGLVHFQQFTFRLAVRPDCKLVMLVPHDEAGGSAALCS